MLFKDRRDAGARLAQELSRFAGEAAVVLALPRGGVPVADEIARRLGAPLDLILVRKLGAPGEPELAIGAIAAAGPTIDTVIDQRTVAMLGVPPDYVAAEIRRETAELERRRQLYLQGRAPVELKGCVAILVDDGVATGSTMRAALRAARRHDPARLVMAVPVGSPQALAELAEEADEIVCLHAPERFGAVGLFYDDFSQTEDGEVIGILARAAGRSGKPAPPA